MAVCLRCHPEPALENLDGPELEEEKCTLMWFGPKPRHPEAPRRAIRGEAYDPIFFPAVCNDGTLRLMTLVDVRLYLRLLYWEDPIPTKACVATWVDDELFEVRVVNANGTNREITRSGSPALWRAVFEAGRCEK